MKNKFCQSCHMPMAKDPQGGGTEVGNERSEKYCSYCYQEGQFTFEDRLDGFVDHTVDAMVAAGKWRWWSKLLMNKRSLMKLERWKDA
ncbi:zinc ribbon domain-containing protein [Halosquirtibacter xylanolyticus]|uniref:zinc ribbon domain-containing protein n=1 Tax=Halosquirtibacter xylanolyticus TaxID=3374599 RepID=UPI0037487398|nr:zinc ribbon domain-containing protein [Prolixibacteraceae bacterium]